MNTLKYKFGLKPLKHDDRDFQVGQIFDLPPLSELPESFDLGETRIEHQKDSDFCSAFALTSLSELQEGVQLSPEWHFAMSKYLSGDEIEDFGMDMRTAAKTSVRLGDLKKEDAPYSLDNKPYTWLRDPANWSDDLKDKALPQKKQSYVSVSIGQYGAFDTIRSFIWKFRHEKKGVAIGVLFGWDLSQKIMDEPATYGTGHAMFVRGWKRINGKDYLIVVNSYGTESGDNGVHYFSRSVINRTVETYGAYALTDMPKEDIIYNVENGIKDTDSWVKRFWKVLLTFIKDIFVVRVV